MKTIMSILMVIIFAFTMCNIAEAQIKNPFKKAKQEAEKKANKEIDKGIENAMNPEEEQKKKDEQEKKEKEKSEQDQKGKEATPEEQNSNQDKAPELNWAGYDFVPGDKVFFEDNQEGEENGEFPSRWDIYSGNVENAQLGGENVIMFRENSFIVPFLENPETPYLPEVFTLEFDSYYNKSEAYHYYNILFYDKVNQRNPGISDLSVYVDKASMGTFEGSYPSSGMNQKEGGWRHVAIAFNKRSLKVYIDDVRVINIPNLKVKPIGISIYGQFNHYSEKYSYIKNIRIAKGGIKLYDRMMQDGKIVATGIRFDSGKATLKPESMGIINTIAEMMEEHPEISFSIEGHTDSDGDTDANQKLSEDRANAVMKQLESMGISSDRLSAKGYGESNPVAPNNTAEGKANNRRVEFVKI
jgi:outer membrane protein OmpA-like peptidoglycan-associated protein